MLDTKKKNIKKLKHLRYSQLILAQMREKENVGTVHFDISSSYNLRK